MIKVEKFLYVNEILTLRELVNNIESNVTKALSTASGAVYDTYCCNDVDNYNGMQELGGKFQTIMECVQFIKTDTNLLTVDVELALKY